MSNTVCTSIIKGTDGSSPLTDWNPDPASDILNKEFTITVTFASKVKEHKTFTKVYNAMMIDDNLGDYHLMVFDPTSPMSNLTCDISKNQTAENVFNIAQEFAEELVG